MTASMTPSTLRALAEETAAAHRYFRDSIDFGIKRGEVDAQLADLIESALKRAAMAEEGAAMFQGTKENIKRACEIYMLNATLNDNGPTLFRVVISEVKG